MKIKMLDNRWITENGFDVRFLVEGKEYDIADSAARSLISRGKAMSLEPRMTLSECTEELIRQLDDHKKKKKSVNQ